MKKILLVVLISLILLVTNISALESCNSDSECEVRFSQCSCANICVLKNKDNIDCERACLPEESNTKISNCKCENNQCVSNSCAEGETKKYICTDGTEVSWCTCTANGLWLCILSPENKCNITKCSEGMNCDNDKNLVGNDRDEHGCIGSAGYSWCEEKQKCLRIWEENCSETDNKFSCSKNSDCVSQCSKGCVNYDWANSNPDKSECFRAWNCSCNNNTCYTDGKKPVQNLPGEGKVKILPETASQRAKERLGELGFIITLKEVGTGNNTRMIYEAEAEKPVKLFGFIKTKAKVSAQVDAETGEIIKTKKPWWSFMASGF